MTKKSVRGMTALVTGAGRGIGRAIALQLAAAGMNVVVHYLNSREAANETASLCSSKEVKALAVCADVRSSDDLLQMRDLLEQESMMPDVLVNNAGAAHYGLLSQVSESEWDDVMNVNLKGMFLCTQLFVPQMVTQKYGRIINISSIWGISGASNEVVYSAAKGGVNAFTKALAKELAPSGVTVNAVAPGVVETSMMDDFTAEDRTALEEAIPAGRFAKPEEIASLVQFIAMPESDYLTGQIISPNGGWLT